MSLRARGDPRLRDRHRLVIGPWSHEPGAVARGTGAVQLREDRAARVPRPDRGLVRLRAQGRRPAGLGESPVSAFILNENRWRRFDDWPPPEGRRLELFLDSGGAANGVRGDGRLASAEPVSAVPSSFRYDPRDPVMSISDWSTRALDQSVFDHRRDVLVYVSEPLAQDLLLVGDVTCVLWAATDAVETDFTAKLVEVRPDGLAVGLSSRHPADAVHGRLRPGGPARARRPLRADDRAEPGRRAAQAGSRIRLDVSSSDFPNFDRNHNTGRDYWADEELRPAQQTIFNDAEHPSRLVLSALPLEEENT